MRDDRLSRRSALALGGAAALGAASGCSYFAPVSDDDAMRYTFWGGPAEKTAVEGVISDYAGASGVPARAEHIPGNYATKLNALVAGNIEPDAGYLSESMIMRWGEFGRVSNLFEYQDRFPQLQGLRSDVVHEWAPGSAVMMSAIEVYMLFFDRQVLEAEGVTPPTQVSQSWDWDDFVAVLDRLTVDRDGRHPSEDGFDRGSVSRFGISGLSGWVPMYNLMFSNGCPIVDETGTRSLFSTAEGLEVVQNVYDLIHEHRVSPSPAQMQSVGGDISSQLVGGRVAMVAGGQWELLALSESTLDYDVGVLPVMQEPVVLTSSGASAVFTRSDRVEEAWALTAALADPEQNPLFTNGLWMPIQDYCYTDEDYIERWVSRPAYPPGYRGACVDATREYGYPLPSYSIRDWTYVDSQISNVLSAAWTGEMTPREACRAVDDQLDGILQGRHTGSTA